LTLTVVLPPELLLAPVTASPLAAVAAVILAMPPSPSAATDIDVDCAGTAVVGEAVII
jgi:hypothetical protein